MRGAVGLHGRSYIAQVISLKSLVSVSNINYAGMRNYKKITKKQLKSIIAGNDYMCPDFLATTCAQWCGLTPWQQQYCPNAVEEIMPCQC
ncbi:hypothetical protein EG343_13295 [Chryseobacterium nakagawai]|uniref:Uncharacterized protein n=2 Tax=Chryseobacterium nakagawai TaxID=1241982 RepID=A0AAD0YLM8_CHRNA|nr:hypothetical protein EG343_13295 [Chryseobacterium nakagawai]